MTGGMSRSRLRSVEGKSASQAASVLGRWNWKTWRLRGSGSSQLVNRVSSPVLGVQERQRALMRRQGVGQARAVLGGLRLDPRQGCAGLLRLDDPRGPGIDIEQVVREPVPLLERKLAQRYPLARVQVRLVGVLHGPSRLHQSRVDRLAGGVLGLWHEFMLGIGQRP